MKTLHLSIIAIVLITILFPNTIFAQSQTLRYLHLYIPKIFFESGEVIPITGTPILPNSPISISLANRYGDVVDSTQAQSDSKGNFTANLVVPLDAQSGSWYLFAKTGDSFESVQIMINSNVIDTTPSNFPSGLTPSKQFKLGIPADEIQCNTSFQLILKAEDGSPACVKPDTANILIKRGWASSIITTPPSVQQTSGNATLPASFEPCNTPFPQSNTGVAVLYMPMNSIGKLCVRYSNFNDFPAPFRGITITNADNLTHEATEISTWNDAGGNTTLPKGNFTTVYWIKTGNQSGFYGLTIFCVPHALAVGYDNNSRIVSGHFPWFGNQFECPMQTYDYHIDSTTGIGVKYIPYP